VKSLAALKSYFRKYRKLYISGIVFILISTLFQVLVPILIRNAIDGLQTDITQAKLLNYSALLLLVSIISGIFLFATRRTIIDASRHVEYDLRNNFLKHIQSLSLRYFQNTSTGDIMAHATNDMSAVRMFVGPAVMYSANTIFTFTIIVSIMFTIHPWLTLLSLLPMPIVSFVVNRLGKRIHKRYESIQSHYSVLTARAQEFIAGVRVIKAYVREDYEIGKFKELSEEYREKNMGMVRLQAFMMPVLMLLIGLSVIVMIWYGGGLVVKDVLTIGELTQFIMYLGMLIWPVIAIGWVINIIQRAAASMARLQKIFDQRPEIQNSDDTDDSITELRGAVDFDHVAFRYSDDTPVVIEDISLNVPEGSSIAVVGPTGSGKTSFVNLIPRLYDVTGGSLKIDGHEIRTIPIDTLRKHIAFVTQETFLFSDTIRANIAYGVDDADMEQVKWAAEIAQIDKDAIPCWANAV
jgi:ATP-binding cassette, subfamily B, multidrug efflux pump